MSDRLPSPQPPCDPFIVVRRYGPYGSYPRYRFVDPEALYVADHGEAYSAVVVGDVEFSGGITLESDFAWIFPQEIRLLGAMLLSQHPDLFGTLTLYLHEEYATIPLAPGSDLTTLDMQNSVKESVAGSRFIDPIGPLDLRDDFDPKDFQHLFDSLRLSSPLMLRGIAALLKGSMLSCHMLFGEEAALLCFISLEAALELVRVRLDSRYGAGNVSFQDALDYVDRAAGHPLGEYLKDCHQLRATIVHPKPARAAMSWVPILQADDYYDTHEAVVCLYRHLLLGEDLGMEVVE